MLRIDISISKLAHKASLSITHMSSHLQKESYTISELISSCPRDAAISAMAEHKSLKAAELTSGVLSPER